MPQKGQINTADALIDKAYEDEFGCWIWEKGFTNSGYAKATVNYKTVLVHRFMYENLVGPIPEGMQLDHLCRDKRCINPDHLEPVTLQENMNRRNSYVIECKHGHSLTRDNLYITPDGRRQCKTCRREAVARYDGRR